MNVYPNLSDGFNIPNTYSLSCLVLDTISRSNFRDMTSWIQNIKTVFLHFLYSYLLYFYFWEALSSHHFIKCFLSVRESGRIAFKLSSKSRFLKENLEDHNSIVKQNWTLKNACFGTMDVLYKRWNLKNIPDRHSSRSNLISMFLLI